MHAQGRDHSPLYLAFRLVVCGAVLIGFTVGLATPALAHAGETNVPAITDVQEAIAILATQPDLMDHALDKAHDATDSNQTRGVDIELVKQAEGDIQAGLMQDALLLLERSIGACPGSPVIDPANAPRTPPLLTSPCPSPAAHMFAMDRSSVGGLQEPVLLAAGAVLILAGAALARRMR